MFPRHDLQGWEQSSPSSARNARFKPTSASLLFTRDFAKFAQSRRSPFRSRPASLHFPGNSPEGLRSKRASVSYSAPEIPRTASPWSSTRSAPLKSVHFPRTSSPWRSCPDVRAVGVQRDVYTDWKRCERVPEATDGCKRSDSMPFEPPIRAPDPSYQDPFTPWTPSWVEAHTRPSLPFQNRPHGRQPMLFRQRPAQDYPPQKPRDAIESFSRITDIWGHFSGTASLPCLRPCSAVDEENVLERRPVKSFTEYLDRQKAFSSVSFRGAVADVSGKIGTSEKKPSDLATFGDSTEQELSSSDFAMFGDNAEQKLGGNGFATFGDSAEQQLGGSGFATFGDSAEQQLGGSGFATLGDSAEQKLGSGFATFGDSADRKLGSGFETFGDSADQKLGSGFATFGDSAGQKLGSGFATIGDSAEQKLGGGFATIGDSAEQKLGGGFFRSFDTEQMRDGAQCIDTSPAERELAAEDVLEATRVEAREQIMDIGSFFEQLENGAFFGEDNSLSKSPENANLHDDWQVDAGSEEKKKSRKQSRKTKKVPTDDFSAFSDGFENGWFEGAPQKGDAGCEALTQNEFGDGAFDGVEAVEGKKAFAEESGVERCSGPDQVSARSVSEKSMLDLVGMGIYKMEDVSTVRGSIARLDSMDSRMEFAIDDRADSKAWPELNAHVARPVVPARGEVARPEPVVREVADVSTFAGALPELVSMQDTWRHDQRVQDIDAVNQRLKHAMAKIDCVELTFVNLLQQLTNPLEPKMD